MVNLGYGPVTLGPLGNLGRNTLNGPSNVNFDFALTRVFKINERHEIDLRAEAFNVFNLTRLNDPIVTLNSPTFGESLAPTNTNAGAAIPGFSTVRDPRIMQFAIKYTF